MNRTETTVVWIDGYLKGIADLASFDKKRTLNAVEVDLNGPDVAKAYESFLTKNPDVKELGLTTQCYEFTAAEPLDDWESALSMALSDALSDLPTDRLGRVVWQVTETLLAESISSEESCPLVSRVTIGRAQGKCIFLSYQKGPTWL